MESKTYLKNLQISPKKLRFYLAAVKKMKPAESLTFLYYGKQKATQILHKAISSAISNAKQTLKVDADLLNFKLLTIEQGKILKRFRPGSRGNVRPIKRKMSHIKIILESKEVVDKAVPKVAEKNVKVQSPNVKEVKNVKKTEEKLKIKKESK